MTRHQTVRCATDVGRGTLRRCGNCGGLNDPGANPDECGRCGASWSAPDAASNSSTKPPALV